MKYLDKPSLEKIELRLNTLNDILDTNIDSYTRNCCENELDMIINMLSEELKRRKIQKSGFKLI